MLIWFRVTFPRVRGDQLMEFGWKVLLPVALANIFLTAIIKELLNFFKRLRSRCVLGRCLGDETEGPSLVPRDEKISKTENRFLV